MQSTPARSSARPVAILATLLLSGCGYHAGRQAHLAQASMVGMSESDLVACAGPPDKTLAVNLHTSVYSYQYKPPTNAGFNLTLPLDLGGVNVGGSGSICNASVRLVDHKVTDLHYSGDNDASNGNDAMCEPIVRGCMRQPEATMQPITGANYNNSSAYRQPVEPSQPAASQEAPAAAAPPTPAKK